MWSPLRRLAIAILKTRSRLRKRAIRTLTVRLQGPKDQRGRQAGLPPAAAGAFRSRDPRKPGLQLNFFPRMLAGCMPMLA
jgi:hypothetical protein